MRTRGIQGRAAVRLLVLAWAAGSALAQFSVMGRPVQVHGFASQGFLYTGGGNNFLTAPTSNGTFQLTDGGLNASLQLTDKLRAGAQMYSRKVGNLGHGRVTLDWAFLDYRFKDWFGVRAGKVKTVYGLYNDTQDMEFLHTWALLPQSLYPLDLRGISIAHTGAGAYGSVPIGRAGSLEYNIYGGAAPSDRDGGRVYGIEGFGTRVEKSTGTLAGADVKWATPVSGLTLGAGRLYGPHTLSGDNLRFGGPISIESRPLAGFLFSVQYSRRGLRIEWERVRVLSMTRVVNPYGRFGPPTVDLPYDARGWYAAAAYRLSKRFEAGTYQSRYHPNAYSGVATNNTQPGGNHVIDQAFTLRTDFGPHWDLKTEWHFMNGFGDPGTSHGFYPRDNPRGLRPRTNLLVIRLGFNW